MFLVHILSMPALIFQLETNTPDCVKTLQSHVLLERSLDLLGKDQSLKIITNSLKGTQSLALLANLIHLFYLEPNETATALGFPTFTVFNKLILLAMCPAYNITLHFAVCVYEITSKYTKLGWTKGRNFFAVA